ncbi:hypothetical protein AcW1_008559 [Taiwanofungus camphoratus]|nr:hypothetical protein AcV5_008848 [Antrodia cinnamomea]KAI0951537.1 hypothetical protein AcW1_008559 [Antrodia cinnamomea]KAI0956429.1 hypothetical protein AcV7_006839 [Antrodia cinnamomea]
MSSTAIKREYPYTAVDEDDDLEGRSAPSRDVRMLQDRLKQDPRFNPPTPSPWKRAGLVLAVVVLFWLAFTLRAQLGRPPKVVHANRYSKEYKYRPAASPVITERLKDGRMRVRGAMPTIR